MKRILVLLLVAHLTLGETPPRVNIPDLGQIEGFYKTSLKGMTFNAFEGVPYARPPVGKLRFKEPTPVKPWSGIWQAKTMYKCMQNYQYTPPGEDFVIGDEDCLYLNIYTPNLDPKANLDVIVYIHGGAFMFLHGGFQGPEYIQDKNVVYINLNYRLGPLGFLSTENEILPGNNGLRDQILALQWIKTNVKWFGGNPNSITIFGMSAGGASIHFHYLSPKSRGLFQRGISQSGSMLNHWTMQEQPLQKAKKLAASLGCTTNDLKKMVECLGKRPGRQIVAAVKDFQPWLYNPFSPFAPVVDSWASDPVLPDHPYNLLKNKKVADLPWMISYTESEGLYPAAEFYFEEHLKTIDERWNELLPSILDFNYTVDSNLHDSVSQKIRQYYLGDRKVTRENFLDFVKILTDRMFAVDIEETIRLQNEATTSPIYFYYFTYRGAKSKSDGRSGTNKNFGACHGDDTVYIFKAIPDTSTTETDRQMIDVMTEIAASFAKTGEPKVSAEWKPVSKNPKDSLTYLKISSPTNLKIEVSELKSGQFWDSLPIRENEKLFSEVKDEL